MYLPEKITCVTDRYLCTYLNITLLKRNTDITPQKLPMKSASLNMTDKVFAK